MRRSLCDERSILLTDRRAQPDVVQLEKFVSNEMRDSAGIGQKGNHVGVVDQNVLLDLCDVSRIKERLVPQCEHALADLAAALGIVERTVRAPPGPGRTASPRRGAPLRSP
jgi:hypothetical protein